MPRDVILIFVGMGEGSDMCGDPYVLVSGLGADAVNKGVSLMPMVSMVQSAIRLFE